METCTAASIDWTKPVRVAEGDNKGKPYHVIDTNARKPNYPVIGYIGDDTSIAYATIDGRFLGTGNRLENVPEFQPITFTLVADTPAKLAAVRRLANHPHALSLVYEGLDSSHDVDHKTRAAIGDLLYSMYDKASGACIDLGYGEYEYLVTQHLRTL